MLFLPLAACSSSSSQDKAIMQNQITRIDERVSAMAKSAKVQADMAANFDQMQGSVMAMTGQLDEFNVRAEMLSKRLRKLERLLAEISKDIKNAFPSGGSAISDLRLVKIEKQLSNLTMETKALGDLMKKPGGGKNVGRREQYETSVKKIRLKPGEIYQKAYNSYLKGDFESAMRGFGEYLKRYPDTDLSDNAAYWIGESLYGGENYKKASRAFDGMALKYPTSNKAPTALLKSAKSKMKIQEKDGAVSTLKKIVDKYPASNEAIIASDRLASMGIAYPSGR